MISVTAGDTQLAFTTIPSALPFIKSGKVNAIAVSTKRPAAVLPNVPTVASVVAGFDTDNWYGLLAPAATPATIVQRVHGEVVQALKSSDVRDVLVRDGAEPIGSTPQEFGAYFAGEIAKYGKVVKASGASAQ